MSEPVEDEVIVFRGSQRACLEFGLVLDARSIAYQLVDTGPDWVLTVPAARQHDARQELTRYAAERRIVRPRARMLVPFPGARLGAAIYACTLILIAYAADSSWFGVDWLAAGDLYRGNAQGLPWWRALTALTLHLDVLHLFGNLLFGVITSVIVSRMFGPGVAWAAILGSGMLANLVEMWISPAGHRAVGASTAVFAALGLMSGYGWGQQLRLAERWLHRWAPLIAGACLLALFGAGTEQGTQKVDVLGHLLGFISGVILGSLLARAGWPRSRRISVQVLAGCAAMALLLAAWLRALWSVLGTT